MATSWNTPLGRGILFRMSEAPQPKPKKVPRKAPGIVLTLTDEQIVEARRLHDRGANAAKIAEQFGCSQSFMMRVLDYKVRPKLFPPIR